MTTNTPDPYRPLYSDEAKVDILLARVDENLNVFGAREIADLADAVRLYRRKHEEVVGVADRALRELDELRSAARRYLACSWNDFGEAHAALRSLVGVEDTTEATT